MYERNGYDWGSLGTSWGSDPIPGSPEVLEGVAATYGSSAENLGRAAENLKRLRSGDQTRSEAVEKIMEKALATSGTLLQVQSRYHTISRALNAYAPELREAQRLSIEAAEAAGPAARRRATARTDNEQARWRTVTFDQGARDQALEDYHRTKSEYLAADAEVNAARAKLDAAIKKRNAAGDKAKNDIGDALKDSPLNDSIGDYLSAAWETIKKVTGAVLEWLWDHIDEICLVIDILSVILALTGVGGPVAAALQVLSKAAKVAHVLANIKQGIQLVDYGLQGLRTGNWGPLVSAVVAIGIGKVLGKGIGGKVKGLAKSGAARHSLKVSQKTVAASNKVLKETIRTGNPASTIIAKRTATLPTYHPGAPTVVTVPYELN